ncbi:MAG: helix-turn-helix domain-containing protein [Pseudomonadota bacterium]
MSHPGRTTTTRHNADISPHLGRRLEDVERDMVLGTLARCGGNRTWAADILGLTLAALRKRLLAYDASNVTAAERQVDERLALLEAYNPGCARPS